MKKFAVITGASLGLGRSFAYELATLGKNLILVSLPNEGLNLLAEELKSKFGVEVCCFETNLAEPFAVHELTARINTEFDVDMLINNAGIGGTGNFSETPVDYIDTIIQLNIRALSLMVRLLLPNLSRHGEAYILNVASMASFSPLPLKTVYPASKVFVYFFSRSLYQELKRANVHISVLHPGPMKTNAAVTSRIEVQGTIGKMGLIPTDKLAHLAIRKLIRKKQVIVPGFLNKVSWLIMKTIPMGLQLKLGYKITMKEINWEKSFRAC
jgi:short-subunit dehydrogenase